jgi:hypothetical protein
MDTQDDPTQCHKRITEGLRAKRAVACAMDEMESSRLMRSELQPDYGFRSGRFPSDPALTAFSNLIAVV